MLRTGGKVLVDQLALHGAELAFCVPGESYLARARRAPHGADPARHLPPRGRCGEHGRGVREADRPARDLPRHARPGATHASIGVHTAYQDSTPLILLIGQVGRDMLEREAFQEIDYRRMFNSMAKWVAQIESAERIPSRRAPSRSRPRGRPGPVVLALPEDMLVDEVEVADPAATVPAVHTHPGQEEPSGWASLLDASERPLDRRRREVSAQAAEDVVAFCEANELPVATSFGARTTSTTAPASSSATSASASTRRSPAVADADLLLVVGPRLGEMTTGGYTLVEPPLPRQTLVHVHAGAEELGRVYQPALAIHAGSPEFAAAARSLCFRNNVLRGARLEAAWRTTSATLEPVPSPGALNLSEVMALLRERLPEDAIVCNGAGNFATWPHRFWQYTALPQPARAHERRDGLRRPGRDRREDRPPEPNGRLLRRRRRLP